MPPFQIRRSSASILPRTNGTFTTLAHALSPQLPRADIHDRRTEAGGFDDPAGAVSHQDGGGAQKAQEFFAAARRGKSQRRRQLDSQWRMMPPLPGSLLG